MAEPQDSRRDLAELTGASSSALEEIREGKQGRNKEHGSANINENEGKGSGREHREWVRIVRTAFISRFPYHGAADFTQWTTGVA